MRWWPLTIAAALAAGVTIGSRASADAPARSVQLADGDRKVSLDPGGLRFDGPEGSALVAIDRLVLTSARQRTATIAIDDANASVSLSLSSDASHRVRAVASGAASELHVESDRTKVDVNAANDGRVSVTGGGADAEIAIDNNTPCWMLAPAVAGKAQRTCNTAK